MEKKEGGEETVSLCGVDEEARRLYLLLRDQPGGRLPLHRLEEAYRTQYGHSLPTHGYRSVVGLLEAMAHTLRLRGKEPRKTVFLNRDLFLSKFYFLFSWLIEIYFTDIRVISHFFVVNIWDRFNIKVIL